MGCREKQKKHAEDLMQEFTKEDVEEEEEDGTKEIDDPEKAESDEPNPKRAKKEKKVSGIGEKMVKELTNAVKDLETIMSESDQKLPSSFTGNPNDLKSRVRSDMHAEAFLDECDGMLKEKIEGVDELM